MKGKEILRGRTGFPGRVVGTVRIVDKDVEKMAKLSKGEIMVALRTTPDHEIYMKKAAAIITDVGGVTSHPAIVAREFGIPAVVGTVEGTTVLKDGQKVVVEGLAGYEDAKDPETGEIYKRPYGAVYEYVPEPPSLVSKMQKLAEQRGIKGIPPELWKRLAKGE